MRSRGVTLLAQGTARVIGGRSRRSSGRLGGWKAGDRPLIQALQGPDSRRGEVIQKAGQDACVRLRRHPFSWTSCPCPGPAPSPAPSPFRAALLCSLSHCFFLSKLRALHLGQSEEAAGRELAQPQAHLACLPSASGRRPLPAAHVPSLWKPTYLCLEDFPSLLQGLLPSGSSLSSLHTHSHHLVLSQAPLQDSLPSPVPCNRLPPHLPTEGQAGLLSLPQAALSSCKPPLSPSLPPSLRVIWSSGSVRCLLASRPRPAFPRGFPQGLAWPYCLSPQHRLLASGLWAA